MSEAAFGHMTVEEFLLWEDGTDTRYELIDGLPVAMAPPAEAHRMLMTRLVSRIDARLASRRPCNAQPEAGVLRANRSASYFVADIAVTCRPNERGRQAIAEPILIVEILSPGTERHDRHTKLPAYRQIASVEEILLIDSQEAYAEILRKSGDNWITELVQGLGASLRLASVDLEIAMAELYDGIEIAEAG
ncbi:MAG TPA: Uma2 family endonuclease [Stellaceae bacterium]|nr:Uma2 family endonuclease [Stellaceae bacterium]